MDRELDLIELENGVKLTVLDAINYNDHTYILVGKMSENLDNMDDDMLVYEKQDDKIIVIEDNDLLEQLIKTFENRLKKN